MKPFFQSAILFILIFSVLSCGGDQSAANSFSPKRKAYYAFFNDIRQDIVTLEEQYSRLEGFTEDTKAFLESREAQERYSIAGLYFEKGLDREQGAYDYADRFAEDGVVILVVVYPPHEQTIWQNRLDLGNRGKGKQVGQNYVYYQVFTAKPQDAALEEKVNQIIEQKMEQHAAQIGKPLD